LILTLKRSFKTKKFIIENEIENYQALECLNRIIRHSNTLKPLLIGLQIKIGKLNSIEEDGYIIIRWDFSL